jgi:hypothetical protein
MTDTREHVIIRAFVELSNELVDGYDIVDLLSEWTANCARLARRHGSRPAAP